MNKNKTSKANPESLFLKCDKDKAAQIKATILTWSEWAKMSRDFFESYGMSFGLKEAKIYVRPNFGLLLDTVTNCEIKKYANGDNPYLEGYIAEQVKAAFIETFGDESELKDIEPLPESYSIFVKVDESGDFVPDDEAIEAYCNVYIEGRALEIYNDVRIASEALRRIFKGNSHRYNVMRLLFEPIIVGINEATEEFTPRADLEYSKMAELFK